MITIEQFEKFCKDFVEKYNGRYFKDIAKEIGIEEEVSNDLVNRDYKTHDNYYCLHSLIFSEYYDSPIYLCDGKIKINCRLGTVIKPFETIEDAYKFFKMDLKETEKPSNVSKVTFNIPIEIIKEDYIEFISKKHNLNKESLELKIVM